MAKQQQEVARLLTYFKSVGFAFSKNMKQMVEDGSIKPPNGYSKEEYISIINTAHEEGVMRSLENKNKKNKEINEVNTAKSRV